MSGMTPGLITKTESSRFFRERKINHFPYHFAIKNRKICKKIAKTSDYSECQLKCQSFAFL